MHRDSYCMYEMYNRYVAMKIPHHIHALIILSRNFQHVYLKLLNCK